MFRNWAIENAIGAENKKKLYATVKINNTRVIQQVTSLTYFYQTDTIKIFTVCFIQNLNKIGW